MLDDIPPTYRNFDTHPRMAVPFGVPTPRIGNAAPAEIFTAMLRAAAGAADCGPRGPKGERPPLPGSASRDISFPEGLSPREFFIQMSRTMAEGRGLDVSGLSEGQLIDDWHYHLLPHLVFNTHAGGY